METIGHADVVVAGGGLAGCCAALEAAEHGARVLLLEKCAGLGGTSRISGGAIAFAGTELQQRQQITDSPSRLLEDLRRCAGGQADEKLLAAFVAEQAQTFNWLQHQGVRFSSVQLGSGQSLPRSNRVDAAQMIDALAVNINRHPMIRVMTSCAIRELHEDGVVVDDDGRNGLIKTSAVVLCSGGFSRNEELIRRHAPALARAQRAGASSCTGDGLTIAEARGAALLDMEKLSSTFGRHPAASPDENGLLHPIYKGAVAVNVHGLRFADESQSYKVLGDACLRQPRALVFQIFDHRVMQQSVSDAATSNFAAALADGRVIAADDLDSLALRAGIDAARLRGTINRYNQHAAAGHDPDFGRSSLANGNGTLQPVAQPPYYAYPCTSAILGTYCGLATDAAGRVLDTTGNPVAGLYAAGEISGGFHGNGYMTGSALAKAAVFGRIAGRHAALESAKAPA